MLVSDIYKVIDDDIPFIIYFDNEGLKERVVGADWNVIPEHVLEWRVYRMFVGPYSGKLFVKCK